MGINSFWLFYIEADSVIVALINWGNGRFYVASIGPRVSFDINDHDSIIKAADESLSSAAASAEITPKQEPLFVGLVIPSSWVDQDGKIAKEKSELILPVLKELDLKPSGFMSNDEAIIEESSKPDDFPASFINIYLGANYFELSLIYFGKIKGRIRKVFDDEFKAQLVEDALLEFNSESTLPPQIYIYGNADDSTVEELKNFSWVGKKNVETFLHFPNIKLYNDNDLINIFFKAITSQMVGGSNSSHQSITSIPPEKIENSDELEIVENTDENTEEIIDDNSNLPDSELVDSLEEVSPDILGFVQIQSSVETLQTPVVDEIPVLEKEIPLPKPSIPLTLPKIKLPKLPKIKINFLIFILPIIPLIFLFLLFFLKSQVTLYLTPYEFEKTVNVTLDSKSTEVSPSIIPVEKKEVAVSSSVTVDTTGQKTVGEKSTGEVTIFNKLEKVQSIPKGSILTDSKGQKFELVSGVQVAAAVIDYNTGTMNFGQVKTSVSAADIGSEYNISKDATLTMKDFSENSIVVKTNTTFTGGTKTQVGAVSKTDKTTAESQLTKSLADAADKKINEEFNNLSDTLKETIQVKKGKIEFDREVDEQADSLTASSNSTVSVFTISSETKNKIIKQFMSDEDGFSNSEINPDSFVFTFKVAKLDTDKSTGSLTIKGSSLPKVDTFALKNKIVGRTVNNAKDIIRKNITRVYNFDFKNNFNIFDILSFNKKNISIDVKTK